MNPISCLYINKYSKGVNIVLLSYYKNSMKLEWSSNVYSWRHNHHVHDYRVTPLDGTSLPSHPCPRLQLLLGPGSWRMSSQDRLKLQIELPHLLSQPGQLQEKKYAYELE